MKLRKILEYFDETTNTDWRNGKFAKQWDGISKSKFASRFLNFRKNNYKQSNEERKKENKQTNKQRSEGSQRIKRAGNNPSQWIKWKLTRKIWWNTKTFKSHKSTKKIPELFDERAIKYKQNGEWG